MTTLTADSKNDQDKQTQQPLLQSVAELPQGVAPPDTDQIVRRAKQLACEMATTKDPTSTAACQRLLATSAANTDTTNIKTKTQRVVHFLSSFAETDPACAEKTVRFVKGMSNAEVLLTSNKNSDQTISYWVQYPIQRVHVFAALLQLMRVQITPQTLIDVEARFGAAITRALSDTQHSIVRCEQLDAFYVYFVVGMLFCQGYHPLERRLDLAKAMMS